MVSGALAVLFMQMGVVRKGPSPEGMRHDRETTLATAVEEVSSGGRARLLLPENGEGRGLDRQSPMETASMPTEHFAAGNQGETVQGVERLESEVGKELVSPQERVAGAVQRRESELLAIKAAPSEDAPRLASTFFDQANSEVLGSERITSINPKLRDQSQTVNAGFEDVGVRTAGEELSWEVHDVFQNVDGPRPFFYVDEYTGTLMFGLGWQH